jgi:hypothetical protein
MQSKTSQVCTELSRCEAWYACIGEDVRLLTERTEALWFQMDDLVCDLQEAETNGDEAEVKNCIHALLLCALALQLEVKNFRSNTVSI